MTPANPPSSAKPDSRTAAQLADLSYEDAREALAEVVRKLETGGTTLEESLALWEQGEELAAICQTRLHGVRAKIDARTGNGDDPSDAETPF